mmetsp:Transcript_18511/g.74398  ORF Transcript_18511/g.74398 Transcript_18511/m.74398 type:complete len:131 (-) Transcript_18511:1503-1895(-)
MQCNRVRAKHEVSWDADKRTSARSNWISLRTCNLVARELRGLWTIPAISPFPFFFGTYIFPHAPVSNCRERSSYENNFRSRTVMSCLSELVFFEVGDTVTEIILLFQYQSPESLHNENNIDFQGPVEPPG